MEYRWKSKTGEGHDFILKMLILRWFGDIQTDIQIWTYVFGAKERGWGEVEI